MASSTSIDSLIRSLRTIPTQQQVDAEATKSILKKAKVALETTPQVPDVQLRELQAILEVISDGYSQELQKTIDNYLRGNDAAIKRAVQDLVPDLDRVTETYEVPKRFAADVVLLQEQLLKKNATETENTQRLFEFFTNYAERFVRLAQPTAQAAANAASNPATPANAASPALPQPAVAVPVALPNPLAPPVPDTGAAQQPPTGAVPDMEAAKQAVVASTASDSEANRRQAGLPPDPRQQARERGAPDTGAAGRDAHRPMRERTLEIQRAGIVPRPTEAELEGQRVNAKDGADLGAQPDPQLPKLPVFVRDPEGKKITPKDAPDSGNPDTGNPDPGGPPAQAPEQGRPPKVAAKDAPDTGHPETGHPAPQEPATPGSEQGRPKALAKEAPDAGGPEKGRPDAGGSSAQATEQARPPKVNPKDAADTGHPEKHQTQTEEQAEENRSRFPAADTGAAPEAESPFFRKQVAGREGKDRKTQADDRDFQGNQHVVQAKEFQRQVQFKEPPAQKDRPGGPQGPPAPTATWAEGDVPELAALPDAPRTNEDRNASPLPPEIEEDANFFVELLKGFGFAEMLDFRSGKDGVETAKELLFSENVKEFYDRLEQAVILPEDQAKQLHDTKQQILEDLERAKAEREEARRRAPDRDAPSPQEREAPPSRDLSHARPGQAQPREHQRPLADPRAFGDRRGETERVGALRPEAVAMSRPQQLAPAQPSASGVHVPQYDQHRVRHEDEPLSLSSGRSNKRLGGNMVWNLLHRFRGGGELDESELTKDAWDKVAVAAILFLFFFAMVVVVIVNLG